MQFNEIPSMEQLSKLNGKAEDQVLPIIEIVANQKNINERFSTGFRIFDDIMKKGFKNGDLVIISGISGEGKTTFAQTLTYNLCKNVIPCLWFSYEVSIEELNRKFLEMGILDFYSAYAPKKNTTGNIEWIKEKIKEGWIKYATKVVFIDHIDFLTPIGIKTGDNETIALKKITTELKTLAIELDIVIVLMAHIKKLENNKEPEMQDIANSAGIFQLADYVFMLFRERNKQYKSFGGDITGDLFTNNSIIKLVKNRETGQNKFLKVIYSKGRFTPLAQENYEFTPSNNFNARD